ncbi:MAG TPA: hypothetical protein VEC15_03620, partial [Actinomycetota bacterium]|nr:hypothetical protein [Actinomycetota bacterium]
VVPTAWGTVVGFALLGAGLSTVVPIVFSAAGNRPDGATALARVVTMSYIGSVVGPVVVGFLTAAAGLRVALGLPVVLATLLALVARRAMSPGDAANGRSLNSGAPSELQGDFKARVHDRTIDRVGRG